MDGFNLRTAAKYITSHAFGRSLLALKSAAGLADLLSGQDLSVGSLAVDGDVTLGGGAWQTLTLADANWTITRTPQWRIEGWRVWLRGSIVRTTSVLSAGANFASLGTAGNPPTSGTNEVSGGSAFFSGADGWMVWLTSDTADQLQPFSRAIQIGDTVRLDDISWPI